MSAGNLKDSKEVSVVVKPAQPLEEDPRDCVPVDLAGTGGVRGIDDDVEEFVKGDAGTGTMAVTAAASVSIVIIEGIFLIVVGRRDGMFKGIYIRKQYQAPDIQAVLARAWSAGVDRVIVIFYCRN
ncbi:hypothetical protein Droror1_Dr00027506 [Drosera rotundifolia]